MNWWRITPEWREMNIGNMDGTMINILDFVRFLGVLMVWEFNGYDS
jgi:hypothetical protein